MRHCGRLVVCAPRPMLRLVGAALLAVLAAACTYETEALDRQVDSFEVDETSRIFAADGTLITELQAEQNRDVVAFDDLPRQLIDAVVAIEDERYWDHHGVDLRGILRAAGSNAAAGEITQGGSTITQQYVKNALRDDSKTVNRKLREALVAWRLEDRIDKETILERYLNAIYFGQGSYGAAAAARTYFGKVLADLTLAESAMLAGLIRAPSATNPFEDPEAALARRGVVLERMAELGSITIPERDLAVAEPLQLAEQRPERYEAGHFVEAVKQLILDDPRFGATPEERRDRLFRGGLRITTTLDMRLQRAAEDAVAQVLVEPASYPDGALAALDPATGAVVAMVGGRDFFGTSEVAKLNLAMGDGRQAGSTFKPLLLAAALEGGIPLTSTYDSPSELRLETGGQPDPWEVENYEGASRRDVTLLDATVHSYNTAFAQLMLDVGPTAMAEMASRLGVESELQPVPALVLGTENVTVLDLAAAYATLANRGARVAPTFVTSVSDAEGAVLYEHEPTAAQVLDPAVADQVTFALEQVIERGTGEGAALSRPAAGKTGTAEGYRDATFVGYTPDYAAAVWVGFPTGQDPMVPPRTPIEVTGGSWPAEIWQRFMTAAHEGLAVRDFPQPDEELLGELDTSRPDTPRTTGGDPDDGSGDGEEADPTSTSSSTVATTSSTTPRPTTTTSATTTTSRPPPTTTTATPTTTTTRPPSTTRPPTTAAPPSTAPVTPSTSPADPARGDGGA